MDFFNKLGKNAKETYKGASKKTSELAKEAKLRMKRNENKAEISDLYREIGKKVYEKHTLSESIDIKIDLEEECTKIDILSAEIETYLNQIRELKNKKQCPKCYNEIELDANFCNHCGAKQSEEEAREVEAIEIQEENEQNVSDADEAEASSNKEKITENNDATNNEN